MPRVRNVDTVVETPLPQLLEALANLQPDQKVHCDNTREEIIKAKENLTRRRHEIYGADSHLEYIEALLVAEASGKLTFKS